MEVIVQALRDALTFEVVGYIFLGVLIGYVVGAIPGMNRATALALLISFTFVMSPVAAISFLIGINKGGQTGSALSAILMNVPGEPSSVVTALDGYPLTRRGRAQKALKVALYASVLGDIFATLVCVFLTVPLARIAVGTGPVEIAAILIFALTFIAAVSGRSFLKGVISGLLGLFLAAPGLDMETGLPRLAFGMIELYDGIPLLAVAIGTLALSEMLVQMDHGWHGRYEHKHEFLDSGDREDRRVSPQEFRRCAPAIFRSSVIGTVIGILPGLGASLASFLAYTVERRLSRRPELFGKGAIEGVAAAEAADNASVPAAMVPMFAIGLPGSLATALLMGAFMLHGLTPGPYLFRDQGATVYAIFAGMIVASLVLLVVGLVGQRMFAWAITVSDRILMPTIIFLCMVGAYLEGGGMFSVYLMLCFGFVGYFMKKFDFSFVTFLIGYILGPMAELSLRQSIILTDANPLALLQHPVAIVFLLLAVFSVWRFGSLHMLEAAGGRKLTAQQEDPPVENRTKGSEPT